MANPQYPKYPLMTTPKGVAVFPWLTRADTKFNKDGVYHTGLALDPNDPGVPEFLAKLDEIHAEAVEITKKSLGKAKIKAQPIYEPEEDEDGNPTGRVIIKCKTNAVKNGAKVDLAIFDAKRNPHPKNIPVYGGSVLRIAVGPSARYVQSKLFVTLYIVGVQVIELQTGGGVSGMFDEEDGYEAPEGGAPESSFDDGDDTEGDDDLY